MRRSRAPMRSQVQDRSTKLRPPPTHVTAALRVGQQGYEGGQDVLLAAAINHNAGFWGDGFRRPTGAAGDHGNAGGLGFEIHDAQTLNIEAAAAGAAGHGKHIGGMQHVGHALLPHPAGENDAVVSEVSGKSPKPGGEAAGATTNNNKGGVGKVGEHIRPESHELILAFTGHQTGNTHHIVPTNPPTNWERTA